MKKCTYCGLENLDDAAECCVCHTREFKIQITPSIETDGNSFDDDHSKVDNAKVSDIDHYAKKLGIIGSVIGFFLGVLGFNLTGHTLGAFFLIGPLFGFIGFFGYGMIRFRLNDHHQRVDSVFNTGLEAKVGNTSAQAKTQSTVQTPTSSVQESNATAELKTAIASIKTAPESSSETRTEAAPAIVPLGEWYYAVGPTRFGPVSGQVVIDKVKSGELDENIKVWTEGLAKWVLIKTTDFAAHLPQSNSNQGNIAIMNTLKPGPNDKAESSPTVEWHYVVGTEKQGPISEPALIAKIKSGELEKRTKIWKEGLPKWILLENTPFIASLPKVGPPPLDQVETGKPGDAEKPGSRPPLNPSFTRSQEPLTGGGVGRDEYQGSNPGTEIGRFMNWYVEVLKNYAVFNGRAGRKGYWMFIMISFAIYLALFIIEGLLGGAGVLAGIYSLAILVPTIALGVRRMHDTDHNGWFLLIPIYNLLLAVTEGQRGNNHFGSDPKSIRDSTVK
jgi:uncharacterized membrane protein YhaH (DUF805 family)